MMSAVMSSFSEGVTFMLQSFRLAFVLPSFIFCGLNALFIVPALPKTEYGNQFLKLDSENQIVIVLAVSFLLGYFLSVVNIWIIRLFEGYHWRDTKPGIWLIQRKQVEKEWWKSFLQKRSEAIFSASQLPTNDPQWQEAFNGKKELKTIIDPMITDLLNSKFPESQNPFLPTSLGNAIAAFEDYPYARYGIDAVLLWPRLLPTLTQKKYASYIERSKAQFDFLINLCFLFLVFSLETLCIGIAFGKDWSLWIISAGSLTMISYLIYKLATLSVQDWGMSIRVAFDLYRYDLLGALNGKAPENFRDEQKQWLEISRFLKKGHKSKSLERPQETIKNEPFDYSKIDAYLKQIGLESKEKES